MSMSSSQRRDIDTVVSFDWFTEQLVSVLGCREKGLLQTPGMEG